MQRRWTLSSANWMALYPLMLPLTSSGWILQPSSILCHCHLGRQTSQLKGPPRCHLLKRMHHQRKQQRAKARAEASQARAGCPQSWWGFIKTSSPARGSATTTTSARVAPLPTPVPTATKDAMCACVALGNILHTNAPMHKS